ncbi:MAG: hypothetical protein OEW84_07220 [Aigarchaeota archaeon]|nr:hypothetical protein [Aigarchaeota archaeon]
MRSSVVVAIAIIALLVGGVAGYFAATTKPGDTVTSTTTAPAVTKTLTVTQTVTSTAGKIAPFSMQVIPEQIMGESIVGQRVVFLVVVTDEGEGVGRGETVSLSATAAGSVTVDPKAIAPGQVAEVTVIPEEASVGGNVTLTVRGERGGLDLTEAVTFSVAEGEDDRGPEATALRDRFVAWLAVNHPELGITEQTKWTGTIVSPIWLVVSHYLFFSDDWEMHVSWHVMIAPHDWAKIDLRHRFTEARPSYAFEISSVSTDEEPHTIDPPESVWR